MQLPSIRLKKNEDRRLRAGHLWIYSNEIDIKATPIKNLPAGQSVMVEAADKTSLGIAYVNPNSLITGRLLSRNCNEQLDLPFFVKKIQTALHLREQLFSKPFYRLIFAEADEIPGLVVDRFGNTLVMQINTAGIYTRKQIIIEALKTVLPEIQAILVRCDTSASKQEGLPKEVTAELGTPEALVLVEENQVRFHAPIWEGQKTGWFYDHRNNRLRLKEYVTGKRVLDVFSYLGAWGIQAAVWGAKQVVCVDSSSLSEKMIIENAELNSMGNISVIIEDAFTALKDLGQAKEQFDVIILDPPAFVKRAKDKKEGLLAYQRINEAALKLLNPEGILFSCSCSMQITTDEFLQTLRRASLRSHCKLQVLERGHQGPDHPVHIAIPETDYLKMVIGRKLQGG